MDPDSKDVGKKGAGEPAKEDVVIASKKSGRKNKTTVEDKEKTKEENKRNELPAILQPKFPSKDNIEVTPMYPSDQVICEEDNELSRDLEREKAENHWEEGMLLVDELQLKEEEMEQNEQREMQENAHASPSDQPSAENKGKLEKPLEKPVDKIEKAQEKQRGAGEKKVDKASSRDKKSGRSEDRKKNKKESVSSDEKKSSEDKKKGDMMLRKKVSAENLNSDELRQSRRRSKRAKKTGVKAQRPDKIAQATLPTSVYKPVTDVKNERSVKMPVLEMKSHDDRGKKPIVLFPKREAGQQQKGQPPAKSPLPTVAMSPGSDTPKNLQSQPTTPQQQQQQQQQQHQMKNKRKTFLKNVLNKTKFWVRDYASDQPMDLLTKSYVKPDYDPTDNNEFMPDLAGLKVLSDEEWKMRNGNNHSGRDDIFINMRPFWLTRGPTDPIPKVRIQLHGPLIQMWDAGNQNCVLPKLSRTEPFCDPKKDSWEKMKAIDPVIGVNLNFVPKDQNNPKELKDHKDRELNRVIANTFHATKRFQDLKKTNSKRKKVGLFRNS